jgi:hypothetical protein
MTIIQHHLLDEEKATLHLLTQAANDRSRAEAQIRKTLELRTDAASRAREASRSASEKRYQFTAERIQFDRAATSQAITERHQSTLARLQKAATDARRNAGAEYAKAKETIESTYHESSWTNTALAEADEARADSDRQETLRKLVSFRERIQGVQREIAQFQTDVAPKSAEAQKVALEVAINAIRTDVEAAETQLAEVRKLARYGLLRFLFPSRRRRLRNAVATAHKSLSAASAHCDAAPAQVDEFHRQRLAAIKAGHDGRQHQLKETHDRDLAEVTRRRDAANRRADDEYTRLLKDAEQHHDAALVSIERDSARLERENQQRHDEDIRSLEETFQAAAETSRSQHQTEWAEMAQAWKLALAKAEQTANHVSEATARRFPDWSDPTWRAWHASRDLPPAIPFGKFQLRLVDMPGGIPEDEKLRDAGPAAFTMPALLPFPQNCSLLLHTGGAGRTEAERVVQMLLFRLLTALPPAKSRFMIIDPVGLGQNFGAFMHLADHDEQIVSSRIWTESHHIEQKLADLTAHMEIVIQKYLRNQFANIADYNEAAGEVAEPFRFVVVANFPANFTPEAGRRLMSIAASGPRCGVYTIITLDPKLPLPQGFDLKEVERNSIVLRWSHAAYQWMDADFGTFPFQLDAPPDDSLLTEIVQKAGRAAKEASRVEVPFEFVAPPENEWWSKSSRDGIEVAIGRAGATKRQWLQLGKGTAQHVLLAGKTGSGKSTLLHALITNVALNYSPEEVELYLVDFKEGVEFKGYATQALPHARVVAIESEREFGLSVLQRLDVELRERGEQFRAAGVQDIQAYRQGSRKMPRILLIIDEFQMFFVEDDKLAQDAALLLDRLVRQGRAFGIHVLLGTQTLGGAYSLARSTIGQMAVRVALPCSEADGHLILGDDNPAARLLARPGEAVYNNANGIVDGNQFFQVVWLPEERREHYLQRIRSLADARGAGGPLIVFEGNSLADIARNPHIAGMVENGRPQKSGECVAWLGDAIAIKEPTSAAFRRHSGSNLLVVGQFDEEALALFAAAFISLAVQSEPDVVQFHMLDGSRPDDPHTGYLERLAGRVLHSTKIGGWRDTVAILSDLATEIEIRQRSPDPELGSRFLFLYGLHRFRDLRRNEDDFGFSSRRGEEAAPNPNKLLNTILREGPPLGIHTILWCDNLNNLNRSLDRTTLRELDMRVLFQMSAADSSNLIDMPLAGKLGTHRAVFHSEDRGQPEKFRPYGLPNPAWLDALRVQLRARAPLVSVPLRESV